MRWATNRARQWCAATCTLFVVSSALNATVSSAKSNPALDNETQMSDSETPSSRVNLSKQMHEIIRLRREMSAKTPEQRRTTTRADARIRKEGHLHGRM